MQHFRTATKEWKLQALVGDKVVDWSYDDMKEARRAWNHMCRHRMTIDTRDPINRATLRMPNGAIYYLDEAVSWN